MHFASLIQVHKPSPDLTLLIYELLLSASNRSIFLMSPVQLLCAAGVNLSGGRSCDGGSGVSGEESTVETDTSKQRKGSQSSLDQLEQEPKVKHFNKHGKHGLV